MDRLVFVVRHNRKDLYEGLRALLGVEPGVEVILHAEANSGDAGINRMARSGGAGTVGSGRLSTSISRRAGGRSCAWRSSWEGCQADGGDGAGCRHPLRRLLA